MEKKQSDVLSILSLIFGIIGLITSLIIIGFIPCVAGLILGIFALVRHEKRGMPIAGIICSGVGIIIAPIVLFSPSPTPSGTVSNKSEQSVDADEYETATAAGNKGEESTDADERETLADMIDHEIYAVSSYDDTMAYILVTNNADVPIDVSTNTSALDASGAVIGAYSSSETCIGPGQSYPVYHYFEDIPIEKISNFDYSVTVDRSNHESVVDADLQWSIENTTDDSVIIKVTNNHDYDIQYLSACAMFFKGNTLVGFGDTYIDNDEANCILQSGASVTDEIESYTENGFDRVEVYLRGYDR